jgi:hypothetical protein
MNTALCFLVCGSFVATSFAQTGPAPVSTPIESLGPRPPLSRATLDHLTRMNPLFDGKSLAGWVQAPVAPFRFATEDVKDFPALAKRLAGRSDAVSAYLADELDEAAKAAFAAPTTTAADMRAAIPALLRSINRVVTGGAPVYEPARFRGITLRPETDALLRKDPRDLELARLNRLLLEDAFPNELVRSPDTAWVVKDGAMASTGAGRGVIYTQEDYGYYRLVFQVRQISGNHVPGMLIFCHRPATRGDLAEAQAGIDALGAIQFQVPNGRHWDYRPGMNKAGDHFTRPVRIRYDLHEWAQVELLVNGKTGVARMAVAQPVGSRGVEILVFDDPAARRVGPIAWQMHNAGLFDQFKDVRIETDPKDDRLLTVE